MKDTTYAQYSYRLPEIEHHYGPGVHLLSDPILLTQVARLSQPETVQPAISWLVRDLYRGLVRAVIANELPRRMETVTTRMADLTPKGVWSGELLDPATRLVTVDIARAGTLPSQVVFETLTSLVSQELVRQDHVYMNRVTDESGIVTGVSVAGSKIGGDVQDSIVLFPDPMGATGGSLSRALAMYGDLPGGGSPKKLISMNLIITPEFIKRMKADHPEAIIYAIRLDRGMSADEVLQTIPGQRWDEERGLNGIQYIVPGAGGLGEILNNSFV